MLKLLWHVFSVVFLDRPSRRSCPTCAKYVSFDKFGGTYVEYAKATPGCKGCYKRVLTRWVACNPPKPFKEDPPEEE